MDRIGNYEFSDNCSIQLSRASRVAPDIAWPFRDACVGGRKSLYTIASLSIHLYYGSYNGDSGVKEQIALTEFHGERKYGPVLLKVYILREPTTIVGKVLIM